ARKWIYSIDAKNENITGINRQIAVVDHLRRSAVAWREREVFSTAGRIDIAGVAAAFDVDRVAAGGGVDGTLDIGHQRGGCKAVGGYEDTAGLDADEAQAAVVDGVYDPVFQRIALRGGDRVAQDPIERHIPAIDRLPRQCATGQRDV